jgi:hypothetical protein
MKEDESRLGERRIERTSLTVTGEYGVGVLKSISEVPTKLEILLK